MPYYAEESDHNRKSKAERKLLARQRAKLKCEEDRYLSKGGISFFRYLVLYPIVAAGTVASTLYLHHSFEGHSIYDGAHYIVPLIAISAIVLAVAYRKDEKYFQPELARIREPAIAILLSRKEKFPSREARLERLNEVREKTAALEAAFYTLFLNNAKFLALVVLAYSHFVGSATINSSYIFSLSFAIIIFFLDNIRN